MKKKEILEKLTLSIGRFLESERVLKEQLALASEAFIDMKQSLQKLSDTRGGLILLKQQIQQSKGDITE